MRKNQRCAFTLMELLVVVGIIVILTGILVPSIGRARAAAKRTSCLANLHSIGQAVQAYMSDNHDYYPPMAPMPTNDILGRESMAIILKPFVGNEVRVFKCPADTIMDPGSEKPTKGETTWYEWQGSSYEPRMMLSTVDEMGFWLLSQEFRAATSKLKNQTTETEKWNELAEDLPKMVLMHDYENFHGELETPNNRMALYADFHVASMDEGQLE